MAFPPYVNGGGQSQQQSGQNGNNVSQQMSLDSITLGQLRAMVGSAPKPKVSITRVHPNIRTVYNHTSYSNHIMISDTMMKTQ